MVSALLSRPALIGAVGLLVFVGGFVAGGKVTDWWSVEPLEAQVADLTSRLTVCRADSAGLQAALQHAGEQVRDLAAGCAQTVDDADQAAIDALQACEDLPENATAEDWNRWLAACSPQPPR